MTRMKKIVTLFFIVSNIVLGQSMFLEKTDLAFSINGNLAILENTTGVGFGFSVAIKNNIDIGFVRSKVTVDIEQYYGVENSFDVYSSTGYVNIMLGREKIISSLTLGYSSNEHNESYLLGTKLSRKIELNEEMTFFPGIGMGISQVAGESFEPLLTVSGNLSFLMSKFIVLSPNINYSRDNLGYGVDLAVLLAL